MTGLEIDLIHHSALRGLPARQKVARQMAKIRRSSLSMAKSHRSYLIKLFATCFSFWLVLSVQKRFGKEDSIKSSEHEELAKKKKQVAKSLIKYDR